MSRYLYKDQQIIHILIVALIPGFWTCDDSEFNAHYESSSL